MRRIICFLLCIVTLVFCGNIITIAESTIPTQLQFKASEYAKSFAKNFGNESNSYANLFFTSMSQDKDYVDSIIKWEGMHIATEPSHLLESGWIFKKDIYKLAIFDMLDISNNNDFIDELTSSQNTYAYGLASKIVEDIKKDADTLKSVKVDEENLSFLTDLVKVQKMFKVIDVAGEIAKAYGNFADAINAFSCYQAIADMQNGVQEVLTAIGNDESNPWDLRLAAQECLLLYNESINEVLKRVTVGTMKIDGALIKTTAGYLFDAFWTKILTSIGGGAGLIVMAGATGIRFLTNTFFELDKRNELYYKLECNVILENAIRRAMTAAETSYNQLASDKNATYYLQSVELYKKIVIQGFDYSLELLENYATSAGVQMLDWLKRNILNAYRK